MRTVKPGEKAPAKKKPNVVNPVEVAAKGGETLALLEAMSERIARAVDNPNTPPRDLAALTRRLHELAKDIAVIKAAAEDDEIADAADTPDEAFDGTV